MNSNSDVKKMLRTSIISFIIIAFGLLLVCGVRPPQPSFEGLDTENMGNEGDELTEEDDLASLLNDDDKEAIAGETSSEGADIFASESEFSDEETDDMNEILSLLESDDDEGLDLENDDFNFSDDLDSEDETPVELASVSDVTGSPGGSEEADQFEGALDGEEFKELKTEAERLTEILDTKNAKAESLKSVLEKYDDKIAVLELENSGAGSDYVPTSTSTHYASKASESTRSSYASPSSSSSYSNAKQVSRNSYSRPKKTRPKRSPYEEQYHAAVNNFTTSKYQKAIKAFEDLIALNPNGSFADNCQYYLGECFLAQNQYNKAVIEFEKVFVFNNNDMADDAQMKLGLTFMKKGDAVQAKMEFDNLLAFYSDSEFARKARSYLRQL